MDIDIRKAHSPGFFRRLAALFYDLVLLCAVLMVATGIVIIPYDLIAGVPFPHDLTFYRAGLQCYLAVVIGLFFVFFWIRGGQTLGMRSWRLRLVRRDGSGLRARDALVRLAWAALCLAPAGIGLLWMLVDSDRMTCYDRLSRTRLVMVEKD